MPTTGITLIMIPARQHLERLPFPLPAHAVHQPVFGRDAAGPPAGQVAFERFGLAGAAGGVAHCLHDQDVDPFEHLRVLALPCEIIAPCVGAEDDDHGMISSCSSPRPASSSAMPSIKCFAFAGDDSR